MSLSFVYIPVRIDHLLRNKIQIVPRNHTIEYVIILYTQS